MAFIQKRDTREDKPDLNDPLTLMKSYQARIRAAGERARENIKREQEVIARQIKPTKVDVKKNLDHLKQGERKSAYADKGILKGRKGGSVSAPPQSLLGAIDKTEGAGNYDTLFGHSQNDQFKGVKVSEMSIGQLKGFTDPNGAYGQWVKDKVGRVATPMGRYQFVGSTMKSVADKMGLPDSTIFDRNTQDSMFEFHVRDTLSRGSTMQDKIALLRGQWEGFKSLPIETLAGIVRDYERS